MTWHDADLTRFGQWWNRARRAGHAFADGAALHGAPPERHWVKETSRALIWGAGLPILTLALALVAPVWAALLFLIYPVQIVRLSGRGTLVTAFFTVLGKFPEALGAVQFYFGRMTGKNKRIIEYK